MPETQCQRLERELLKGRRLSMIDMLNELGIGNHTGRISDLRPKFEALGCKIECDESKGYGVYYLVNVERSENAFGKGDAWEG